MGDEQIYQHSASLVGMRGGRSVGFAIRNPGFKKPPMLSEDAGCEQLSGRIATLAAREYGLPGCMNMP